MQTVHEEEEKSEGVSTSMTTVNMYVTLLLIIAGLDGGGDIVQAKPLSIIRRGRHFNTYILYYCNTDASLHLSSAATERIGHRVRRRCSTIFLPLRKPTSLTHCH